MKLCNNRLRSIDSVIESQERFTEHIITTINWISNFFCYFVLPNRDDREMHVATETGKKILCASPLWSVSLIKIFASRGGDEFNDLFFAG